MKRFMMCLAVLLLATTVTAQDYQARLLFHPQIVLKGNFGVAGWVIFPDLDDDFGESSRHLQVAGLMYRDGSRWMEVMYGFVDYQTKPSERLFNVRISERGLRPLSIFMDLHFYKNRRLVGFFVDWPLIGMLRVGLESENWFLDGKPDRLGIGPRVSVLLTGLPLCKSANVTIAYQRRFEKQEPDFIRTYFLVNL